MKDWGVNLRYEHTYKCWWICIVYPFSVVPRNKAILWYPFSLICKQLYGQYETPLTARLLPRQDTAESETCSLGSLRRNGSSAGSQTEGPFTPRLLAFPRVVCVSVKSQTVSQTQTTSSASDTTAARPLTHTFSALCPGSTLSHHHSICQASTWLACYELPNDFCLLRMRTCSGKNLILRLHA